MSIKCCFNRKHNITSYYSDDYHSSTITANRKLIPLKHIDKLNTSMKNMKRIFVTIDNPNGKFKLKNLFKLEGEFPTYISDINSSQDFIRHLDVQIGDCILMVNNFNVSRASAKSVRKLIEKSKTSLKLILIRPKTNNSTYFIKQESKQLNNYIENINQNDLTDYGYFSIPATDSERNTITSEINKVNQTEEQLLQSLSNTISSRLSDFTDSFLSIKTNDNSNDNDLFKSKLENYLYNLQDAIQTFVRPCIVLEILSIKQCLDLYQNVEKLIPVTRFMLNIINSSNETSLPNAESVNIVFESYKTYLDGLPKAICLLTELTKTNEMFISFLDEIKDSFKIFDLLFMPLKFVQIVIEYMQDLLVTFKGKNYDNEESKLNDLINDLYNSSTRAHNIIKNRFETDSYYDESDLSTVYSINSDYFNTSYSSNESSIVSSFKIVNLPILIHQYSNDSESNNASWDKASIMIDRNEFKIRFNKNNKIVDSNNLVHIKKSFNSNLIYIKLLNQHDQTNFESESVIYKIRLENPKLKDNLFDAMCKIYQK